MSYSWRYDVIAGGSARANTDGVEVSRSCIVSGITVNSGTSDPEVIIKLTEDPGFPGFGSLLPTNNIVFTGATLRDVIIRTRHQRTNSVECDLIYRKRGNGAVLGELDAWTLEESGTISHVQTASTAKGVSQITVWYKAGTAPDVGVKPDGADEKIVQMNVMRPSRILRATAHMTGEQWNAIKVPIRATVGLINDIPWGSSPTGTWFHAPLSIQSTDRNKSLTLTLTFLENPLGWYGLGVYKSPIDGKIPRDIATEEDVRAYGPPAPGFYWNSNGLIWASLYDALDFNDFPFTPDDA